MTNVCFFAGDIGRIGGTERVSIMIANELSRSGHRVSFLSLTNGENASFAVDDGVELHSLHGEQRSANLSDYKTIRLLRTFLIEHEIDYIVDIDVIQGFYSIPACARLPTKVISWEHFNYYANVGGLAQRWRRKIARMMAARFAHRIVTLTERDAAWYTRNLRCGNKVIAINNPIAATVKSRSDGSSRVVIAVGRLATQKGFDLLLIAWQTVALACPGWKLRIVGSGEEELPLKAMAKELRLDGVVEFVPVTNDISAYYRGSAIYAMASRFEGFPMVLLEAKSFGLPIVSFDCDTGPSEIVRDGVDGVLVRDGDVSALASELIALIKDPVRRATFGDAAFEDDRFHPEKIISAWNGLFT